MSAQHTPGPWTIQELNGKLADIRGADGGPVAFCSTVDFQNGGRGKEVDEANAHLIAAAPELLDMAKEMQGILEALQASGAIHLHSSNWPKWEKVINSAEGISR